MSCFLAAPRLRPQVLLSPLVAAQPRWGTNLIVPPSNEAEPRRPGVPKPRIGTRVLESSSVLRAFDNRWIYTNVHYALGAATESVAFADVGACPATEAFVRGGLTAVCRKMSPIAALGKDVTSFRFYLPAENQRQSQKIPKYPIRKTIQPPSREKT